MHTGLLHTHSLLRYFILFLLILIVVRLLFHRGSLFNKRDKQLVLGAMIIAHIQLLLGIALLFVSPYVQFNMSVMKDPQLRYWSMEHSVAMIVVVVLITLARVHSRKAIADSAKRKRVLGLMAVALSIALVTLYMSERGVFLPT